MQENKSGCFFLNTVYNQFVYDDDDIPETASPGTDQIFLYPLRYHPIMSSLDVFLV